MNTFDPVAHFCKRIEARYNPENDAGTVTWADMDLADAIKFLSHRVMELERIISQHQLDKRLWGDNGGSQQ